MDYNTGTLLNIAGKFLQQTNDTLEYFEHHNKNLTKAQEEKLYDLEITVIEVEKFMKANLDDTLIEKLWENFEDVPINPETEEIEQKFFIFPVGTDKMTIWEWFNENYSRGIEALVC